MASEPQSLFERVQEVERVTNGMDAKVDAVLTNQAKILMNQSQEISLLLKILAAVDEPRPGTIVSQKIYFALPT